MCIQLLNVTLNGSKTSIAETLKAVVSVMDANPALMMRKVRRVRFSCERGRFR